MLAAVHEARFELILRSITRDSFWVSADNRGEQHGHDPQLTFGWHVCVSRCARFRLRCGAAGAADSDVSPVDTLARNVERAEAIRAVKDLQYAYSHYAQFGLWTDLGSLFTDDGEAICGDDDRARAARPSRTTT